MPSPSLLPTIPPGTEPCSTCAGLGYLYPVTHVLRVRPAPRRPESTAGAPAEPAADPAPVAMLWCGLPADRAVGPIVRLVPRATSGNAHRRDFLELQALIQAKAELAAAHRACRICMVNLTARHDALARLLEWDPSRPLSAIGATSTDAVDPLQVRSDVRSDLAGGEATPAEAASRMRAAPPIPGVTPRSTADRRSRSLSAADRSAAARRKPSRTSGRRASSRRPRASRQRR
jgi:hypothetical protein